MDPARRNDLARLLPILACPVCQAPLSRNRGALSCAGGHVYHVGPLGIPELVPAAGGGSPRAISEDDAAAYAAMHAFAFSALGRGEAEGFYRTISDLVCRSAPPPRWVLDAGCGAGRTLVDAATAFPRALVIGVDRSPGALTIAYAVTRLRGPAVEVDLRRWGFGVRSIVAHGLRNVRLVQAETARMPFALRGGWPGFDLVTCANLLDRVDDPDSVLAEVARVTRPGGRLILTSPMNWRQPDGARWQGGSTLADLCDSVERAGYEVELAFDGLVYREILDARGSLTDWRVAVLSARRRASA